MSARPFAFAFVSLAVGLGVAGCRKSTVVVDERGACDREAGALGTWLGVVLEEGDVPAETIPDPADENHYLDRPMPRVTLAASDERPSPRPSLAMITLDNGTIAHDDLSESIQNVEVPGNVVKLAAKSVLSPTFGGGGVGSGWISHPILLFVGEHEHWGNVVAVVEALTKAGFTTVHFPFAAASRATPPPFESPAAKRILALETDAKTMPWRRDVASADELRRANASLGCPGIAAAFEKEADDSVTMDAQRTDFMKHAADAFARCSCRGDISAIRAFAWTRFGRHWGPTTVTYEVDVARPDDGDPQEIISGPKNASWSELSRQVAELARRDAGFNPKPRVRFVAR